MQTPATREALVRLAKCRRLALTALFRSGRAACTPSLARKPKIRYAEIGDKGELPESMRERLADL